MRALARVDVRAALTEPRREKRWLRGAGRRLAAVLVTSAIAVSTLDACAAGAGAHGPTTASQADLAASLDRLRAATLAPGALALVVDGRSRTAVASGTTSIGGAALTPTARFRAGSITKPVVAALVLISVERGELGLDDIVSDRLPGVLRPPAVTVRQLLAHTSGVFDEGNEGDIGGDVARLADPALRAEAQTVFSRHAAGQRVVASCRLLVALAETHERYFAPGMGYHYSNINYQLLGMLLERATGTSLASLLRTRIVEPLGLHGTTLAPADLASPDLRGYDTTATGAMSDLTDDLVVYGNGGNGGLVTTADELLAILRAVVSGRLFGGDLVAEMERPVRESYGLGLATYKLPCGTFVGHGGSVSGTRSIAMVSTDGARAAAIAIDIVSGTDPGLASVASAALCGS